MCGIAGFVSDEPLGRALLEAMVASLQHRGPDDEGIGLWNFDAALSGNNSGRVGLGQKRLSIIDLSPMGRNPMPWDEERLWITFNGEIYNFRELRLELEGFGHRFRSRTDTEVILAAYDQWGEACVDRFVGMFAFGLWDAARRRLFLARDRFGKKPLYYAEYAGRFVFASELKALLTDPEFPREIDPEALSLYLRYGYVPAPYSVFRAARKLRPGHTAALENGRLAIRQYWDPVAIALSERKELRDEEAQQQFENLLRDAVRHRMISDVPLGAFLSGGIDSSLVVALMQEQSAQPVKTFTIRFENPAYNEADYAAAVANHLGTDHHEEICTVSQMLDLIEVIPEFFDEPFADSSALPTYLVSKITRQHVTVALSGDGGDELFFGYPRYHFFEKGDWLLRTPRLVRRTAAALVGSIPKRRFQRAAEVLEQDEADRYARFVTWWPRRTIEQLTGRPAYDNPVYTQAAIRLQPLASEERPPVLDSITYLPEDILTKVDRASMAVSLEARAPLLDHRVAELALRLPLRMKYRGGVSKWLLRQILYKKVPPNLIERPKMGFGVPLRDWFRGPLRGRMEDLLAGPQLEALGLDPRPARALWKDFLAKRSQRPELLWSLFALTSWSARWRSASALQNSRAAAGS